MSLFRRHRHDWEPWSLILITYVDSFDNERYSEHKQERRCRTCGRYQLRKIRRR